jgi:hypothetical protein
MAPKTYTQQGMFPGTDRQVTVSTPKQSRSESAVAINPIDSTNMIAVSKKFVEPAFYHFTVEPMVTRNSGFTWSALPLPLAQGWDGLSDPVVAFDDQGTAFVMGMPLQFTATDVRDVDMAVFRLPNGSSTWSAPQSLIAGRPWDAHDDKPWMACDRGASSPFKGHVYVTWGNGSTLRLARSSDRGLTWTGAGNLGAGADVPGFFGVFAPEVSVDDAGIVHVVWSFGATVTYTRSTDGGATFEPARQVVTMIHPISSPPFTRLGSFAEFPHAKFRVLTLATGCAVGTRFIVAWSDIREQDHARIYYHYSDDSGVTWAPSSGQPLYPSLSPASDVHQFHPQLAADGAGVVACAFYEFGLTQAGYRISARIMGSFDHGTSFELPATISDAPWDPAINAPPSHGNPDDAFIGEYFGLDGGPSGFAVISTDTRTGVQELFFDYVDTSREDAPFWWKNGIVATLLGPGVANDGGGVILIGGKIIRIPPRGPSFALLQAVVALEKAEAAAESVVDDAVDAARTFAKSIMQGARG